MLGADQRFAQFLHDFGMRAEIERELLLDFGARQRQQRVVNIVAAEMRVAVRREHLIDIALVGGNQFQDRNIERAAAEIVDGDFAALLLVQAVGERCGGRLVHEAQNFEAGDSSRIFRGLALRVVEIRGDGDHRAIDRFRRRNPRPRISVRAG